MNTAIDTCRFSVIAQSGTATAMTKSPLDVSCKTRYLDFTNTQVKEGLSPDKKSAIKVFYNGKTITTFPELNDYIVNQVVAEEMRICYFQFGEGKVKDLFANNDDSIGNKDDVCFICTQINFDKTIGSKTVKGFIDYINRTEVNGKGYTYLEYFDAPSESENTWSEFTNKIYDNNPSDKMVFDTSQTYDVVFRKDYDIFSKNGYYIYFIPMDQLNNVCDIVVDSE